LLAAFDHIAKGGAPELVLVSGYSGVGKSSVVNELQPVLVAPRGLFASVNSTNTGATFRTRRWRRRFGV